MNILRLFAVLALTAVLCPLTSAHAATFTTNAVISGANLAFDGQDIVIDGAVTVTIDGPHAFNSLLVTNGAVLTHSPCRAIPFTARVQNPTRPARNAHPRSTPASVPTRA